MFLPNKSKNTKEGIVDDDTQVIQMASLYLCLNSLSSSSSSSSPSQLPRKLTETYSSSYTSSTNARSTRGSLKPIVISGDPPTFVSAPGRRIVAG